MTCIDCKKERKICCRERCNSCYTKLLYRENPDYKEKSLAGIREWAKLNPEKVKAYAQKHYIENKEYVKSKIEKWRLENPEKVERSRFLRDLKRFGLTEEEYIKIKLAQNNCCAICGWSFFVKIECKDHDHKTGKFRGLICKDCNTLLGMVTDSTYTLKNAIKYLENRGVMLTCQS